ncbi:MAG: tyrosine-type recombinase/integrase, partial [Methanosphaera sp.]|nr:tyrosine-type recombinase/integrase [Methanosphaera sp.]
SKLVKKLRKYSKNNSVYIFESERQEGQPKSIRNIQYRFRKLAKRIDHEEQTTIYSKNLKPHNLRHSFAIAALKTNEINYVKEFLGHENISTTQIYTNLKEEDVVERFGHIKII